MERRDFIRQGAGFAVAPAILRRNYRYAEEFADKRPRVGLIGSGWYRQVRPATIDPGCAGRCHLAL
jgi:hypothetical protein